MRGARGISKPDGSSNRVKKVGYPVISLISLISLGHQTNRGCYPVLFPLLDTSMDTEHHVTVQFDRSLMDDASAQCHVLCGAFIGKDFIWSGLEFPI